MVNPQHKEVTLSQRGCISSPVVQQENFDACRMSTIMNSGVVRATAGLTGLVPLNALLNRLMR